MSVSKTLRLLEDNLTQADEAVNHLSISVERCKSIFKNKTFSEEQLIDLEALTGRFARLSDIVIQKVLKTIDRLDESVPGTVRDRILEAEKKGIVKDANNLLEIRDTRNIIAHEYEFNNLKELVTFVLKNADILIETVKNSKQYSAKFYAD